jgi:hypothetical protein
MPTKIRKKTKVPGVRSILRVDEWMARWSIVDQCDTVIIQSARQK